MQQWQIKRLWNVSSTLSNLFTSLIHEGSWSLIARFVFMHCTIAKKKISFRACNYHLHLMRLQSAIMLRTYNEKTKSCMVFSGVKNLSVRFLRKYRNETTMAGLKILSKCWALDSLNWWLISSSDILRVT